MKELLPNYRKFIVDSIINSVNSEEDTLYAFGARTIPFENDIPVPANDSVLESQSIPQHQLQFGKRLFSTNIAPVIKKIIWSSGVVYDRYDDTDADLLNKSYYVMTEPVTDGGFRHIFKCLKNGNGSICTEKPDILQTKPFEKSDGYVWKYMYSISQSDYDKFSSAIYIPVIANNDIVSTSLDSSGIDDIIIENPGINYYTTHSGLIRSVVNSSCVQIDTSASPDNDYFNNSSIYMYNLISQTGQLKEIQRYEANTSGKWCILKSEANTAIITPGLTEYKISPTVKITGDGSEKAYAYSVCNSNGELTEIKIINRGVGYSYANVQIIANTSFGNNAVVRAIIPPLGGHGFRTESELNIKGFSVYIQFDGVEAGNLPAHGSYSTIGLVRNPKTIANTTLKFMGNTFNQILKASTTSSTIFQVGDTVSGLTSGAEGIVYFSNTSTIWLTGDKNFTNETIKSKTSNNSTGISINTKGDLYNKDLDILYVYNSREIERNVTQKETYKFIVEI